MVKDIILYWVSMALDSCNSINGTNGRDFSLCRDCLSMTLTKRRTNFAKMDSHSSSSEKKKPLRIEDGYKLTCNSLRFKILSKRT